MSKPIKPAVLDTATAPTPIGTAHVIDVVSPDRRRPVIAINDDGELTVCSSRTARKHGWKLEGTLFERTRSAKRAKAAALGKGKKLAVDLTGGLVQVPALKSAPHRREADKASTRRAGALHIADAVHDALINSLLETAK